MLLECWSPRRPGTARAIVALRSAILATVTAVVLTLLGDVQAESARVRERGPTRTIRSRGLRVSLEEMRRIEGELAKRPAAPGPPDGSPDEDSGPLPVPATTTLSNPDASNAGTVLDLSTLDAAGSIGGPLPMAPPLSQGFPGMQDDHDTIPPDTHGAAGISHLASVVNRRIAFFDKTTGAVVFGPLSNQAFWGALGSIALDPGTSIYDARVIFDPYSERFIVVAIRRPGANPWVFLAISNGSTPETGFTLFAIDGDASTPDSAPDFPGLGVGPDHVYITHTMILKGSNQITGSKFWVIDKLALLSGSLVASEFDDGGGMGVNWQPATSFGPTSVGYIINEGWVGSNQERLVRIQGVSFPSGSPVLTDLGFIQVGSYDLTDPLRDAPQFGCVKRINTNSSYLVNAVWRNGKIWTTHHVSYPFDAEAGRTDVAWYEIDPSLARRAPPYARPLQQGRVSTPGRWFYYPSIAVTEQECVALGFSGSDVSLYGGAFYTVRRPTDPPGTMRPVGVLKPGESSYYKRLTGPRNRWGDYSATVVDPADGGSFWTLQEYALPQSGAGCPSVDTGVWGTWWGHFPCEADCRDDSDCDDGNPCSTDACNQGVCANEPVADGGSCSDGVFCNGSGTCRGGVCLVPRVAPACDDTDPCTSDSCDRPSDRCVHPVIPDSETASGPDGRCGTIDDNPSLFGADGSCGTSDDAVGDGLCDAIDNCPSAPNPAQEDRDGDRQGDVCDNCPADFNPGRDDADGDGLGDACDPCTDTDGDGFGNPGFLLNLCPSDNCPADANPQQADLDRDGVGDACDLCTDADHDGFGNPGFPRNVCAPDNCPEIGNADQQDTDADRIGDPCDPCTDWDHDGFGDPRFAASTCPADNCVVYYNPSQADADRDGIGDICDYCTDSDGDGFGDPPWKVFTCASDNCPAVSNPDQSDDDGDGIGDACDVCPHDLRNDADGDGACGDADNCPAANPGQQDADADGVGDACDNCPSAANPDQADANHDGSGDACQPTLVLSAIRQRDGEAVEVVVESADPEDDPLSGTLDILALSTRELTLSDSLATADCGLGFLPDDVPGEGIAFANGSVGAPFLFDLDTHLGCSDGSTDYWMAPGTCDDPRASFDTLIDLSGAALPAAACVRRYGSVQGGGDLVIQSIDASTLSGVLTRATSVLGSVFDPGRAGSVDITGLQAGRTYRVVLTVTDGTTAPVKAAGTFVHHGEPRLLIVGPDSPPRAVISGAAGVVECQSSSGASVTLDASASTDPDSTPGTNDDLVSFLWVLDPGRPSERILGGGMVLSVTLSLGEHAIDLRVTDSQGVSDSAGTRITVVDTAAPSLSLSVDPAILWPPNHRLVPVRAAWGVSDRCDPSASARLVGVTSSEPDDAPGDGDGRTTGDIAGAATGGPDAEILLRAERAGTGPGRTYELTYGATDASGNSASALALVRVPRDLGEGPEPVLIRLEPNGTAGMARLYWNPGTGGELYDVIAGDIASLAEDGGRITLGVVRVPGRGVTGHTWSEPTDGPMPAAGEADFYLVQYRVGGLVSGYGTECVPLPREPASCEGGCPPLANGAPPSSPPRRP